MDLTRDQVSHLFSRAGFGASLKEVDSLLKTTDITTWVSGQKAIELSIEIPEFTFKNTRKLSKEERKALRKEMLLLGNRLNVRWIKRMVDTRSPLQEKMTLFWHGHFACNVFNIKHQLLLNNIMRTHALGDFRTLLTKVSQSAAMIKYLHLQQNKKQSPNEDFARELCELFTLGRDTVYAEKDIPEIARAFTGWMVDAKGDFFFNQRRHDFGKKTIFGKTGQFQGEDVFDLILERKETAYFLATKLYRYFVNPVVDEPNVRELADVLYQNNYHIGKTMTYLFQAAWFYDSANLGCKIKSPVELLVGLCRSFAITLDNPQGYILIQRFLEQVLFKPPNVAGWPGDKKWIDSSRLAFRMRLPSVLLTNGVIDLEPPVDLEASPKAEKQRGLSKRFGAKANWSQFFKDNKGLAFEQVLLRCYPSSAAKQLMNSHVVESEKEKVLRILSLPEYQLC
jgi:uncharacterized protein (DUF1800 family)